jgi:hypothetical protein
MHGLGCSSLAITDSMHALSLVGGAIPGAPLHQVPWEDARRPAADGLTVIDAPSYLHLAYRPGVPIAHALIPRPVRAERKDT